MEIKEVQTLLNSKAEKKLVEDIEKIKKFLYDTNYKFIKDLKIMTVDSNSRHREVTLATILSKDYEYYQKLYDLHIQDYYNKESSQFLEKVESIQAEIDELKDSIQ